MFHSKFQEDRGAKDSKLQAVFSKLSGVLPRAQDLGNSNPKTMSSEIIESVLADKPVPVSTNWNQKEDVASNANCATCTAACTCCCVGDDADPHHSSACVTHLARTLEAELRRAKRTRLACGEVLVPRGLLRRVAADVLSMAESEPCGLRGCCLYVFFEEEGGGSEEGSKRRLAAVHCDPTTASTFELYLTLRRSTAGWLFLPRFIRNLTRGGTIVVSPAYTLSKKKLYRSYREE